ncbi:MAG TPA: DUF438 domain-containing protein [Erysipelothrix sp.]|nr:DUF438 domain-containing protein [Erysipelothrix sp.]
MSKTQELGQLILKLHDGIDPDVVKEEFKEQFGTVTSREIMRMEQELVENGMPASEIQRLCDIHADVFNQSIEEIHAMPKEHEKEGHPIKVLQDENRALEKHLEDVFFYTVQYENSQEEDHRFELLSKINELFDINKHYRRKEQLFFPLLEKYGFDAAPKVMWGVDDEIRDDLKAFSKKVEDKDTKDLNHVFTALRKRIEDMIFKEEMIMIPMIAEEATKEEWLSIAYDSEEIGYCLVTPKEKWYPNETSFYEKVKTELAIKDEKIHFGTGVMSLEELEAMLNVLPIDISFIDADDLFKYFNMTEERVFIRSKAALSRSVHHAHPPRTVHMVEQILEDLKSGKKDVEDFWLEFGDKFVYISFHAVRNEHGQYLGVVEVSHDISKYRSISGTKRLKDLM